VDGASVAIACNKVGISVRIPAVPSESASEVKRAIAFDGESPSCDNILASSVRPGTLSYFRVIFRVLVVGMPMR